MKYHSKKDIGMVGPLWFALLLPFLWGIPFLTHPHLLAGSDWLFLCIVIPIDVLVVGLTYPMYYEITATTLLVRSGVIRVKIPLTSIQQVVPDRTLGSAPAWSLDRLRVDYRQYGVTRVVHISPKDKVRFMQNLTEYAEGLEVKDGRVVRRH